MIMNLNCGGQVSRIIRKRSAVVAIVAAVSLGFTASPAMAGDVPAPVSFDSEGSPVYAWPTEKDIRQIPGPPGTDAVRGSGKDALRESSSAPQAETCPVGWADSLTNGGSDYDVHFNTSVANRTNGGADYQVKTDTSDTTSWSLSAGLEVEASALLAKVKGTINGNVTSSMTTSYGTQVNVHVNPNSTIHVQYGIYIQMVNVHRYWVYSNCNSNQHKYGTFRAPYAKHWNIFY